MMHLHDQISLILNMGEKEKEKTILAGECRVY